MHAQLLSSLLLLGGASAAVAPRAGPPCSEAVVALATGIHLNIQGQYAEYNGTQTIIDLETSEPGNLPQFFIDKGELLSDIQAGMNIRQFNQEIAPPGNPAIPGLAQYATAQQAEQKLAQGLVGNYVADKKSLDTLKTDIQNGIKLNEKNLAAATSECQFTLVFPPADQSAA